MIVFDLACRQGRVFEAWFGSSGDWDDQKARGLVSCPICGDGEVAKSVMAPNLAAKGNRAEAPVPMTSNPAAVKAVMAELAAAQRRALDGSEHVGDRFASEARAIHLGETAAHSIHGRATRDEAASLAEDGITAMPLPFPVADPLTEN